jgi:hypothetical protein
MEALNKTTVTSINAIGLKPSYKSVILPLYQILQMYNYYVIYNLLIKWQSYTAINIKAKALI